MRLIHPSGHGDAGLTSREVEAFRRQMVKVRAELVADINAICEHVLDDRNAGDLSHAPLHLADTAWDAADQARSGGLVASERRTLQEIDAALGRIEQGTYGICQATGKPISRARLRVIPWARYTTEAARGRGA